MRYFLWLDGKQEGPYEPAKIREMIDNSQITNTTLAHPEEDTGNWNPIRNYPQIFEKPPENVLPWPVLPKPTVPAVAPVVKNNQTLILITAVGMMFIGGMTFMDQMSSHDETVLQQIASRIGMLGGVCIFGFGLVTLAVCTKHD
jgi:hypothetical protein